MTGRALVACVICPLMDGKPPLVPSLPWARTGLAVLCHRQTLDCQIGSSATGGDAWFRYRVFAGQIELGAAWKETSSTGREYLSVKLDDPSLPAPIYASLVEAEGTDEFTLIWSRRQAE